MGGMEHCSKLLLDGRDGDVDVKVGCTPGGVEFGIGDDAPTGPAPTLVSLGSTIEDAFTPAFAQAATFLGPAGYRHVSIDLPDHGRLASPERPDGLAGWARRVAEGHDFVAEFNARLSEVVDFLIAERLTDRDRIAVCGTSRGGFLALRYAAHDARVACVVGYAPVTDLRELSEFAQVPADAGPLSLDAHLAGLAGRPVFVVIGDRDERVGTDAAIRFARRLSDEAARAGTVSNVALHVLSEPRGHTTPAGGARLAARWIHRVLGGPGEPATATLA